jgi:ABC-type Fe3+ transport system permease subunit
MIRAVFEEALLFLLPFALFALYLVVRRRNPLARTAWGGQVPWLVMAGLVCAVGALLVTGLTAERQQGAFEPPHMEDGRLVPGQFR